MAVTRTLKDQIDAIRRIYNNPPSKKHALYLYTDASDFGKQAKTAVVYTIWDSSEGNATLYKLYLDKREAPQFGDDYSVDYWAQWIEEYVPKILHEKTAAYLNRTIAGAPWTLRGILGWHFVRPQGQRQFLPSKFRRMPK